MNTKFAFTIIKIITVIVLIGLFALNSAIVFNYFIAEKKVTSSEDQTNDALVPPEIFICREVAFTDDMKEMAELDDFFNNTLHLNYSLGDAEFNYLTNNGVKNDPTLITISETIVNASRSVYEDRFKVEHVYSYSRGLCYKFLYLREVNIICFNILNTITLYYLLQ